MGGRGGGGGRRGVRAGTESVYNMKVLGPHDTIFTGTFRYNNIESLFSLEIKHLHAGGQALPGDQAANLQVTADGISFEADSELGGRSVLECSKVGNPCYVYRPAEI